MAARLPVVATIAALAQVAGVCLSAVAACCAPEVGTRATSMMKCCEGARTGSHVSHADDRNFDTNANDRPEGIGRNSARGFDSAILDVRLARRFQASRAAVEVSIDAFNVLNRTNLLLPNNTFGQGSTPVATFGRATAAADPRQIQFGVRVGF
jgi:hypothetical protein